MSALPAIIVNKKFFCTSRSHRSPLAGASAPAEHSVSVGHTRVRCRERFLRRRPWWDGSARCLPQRSEQIRAQSLRQAISQVGHTLGRFGQFRQVVDCAGPFARPCDVVKTSLPAFRQNSGDELAGRQVALLRGGDDCWRSSRGNLRICHASSGPRSCWFTVYPFGNE